MYIGDQWERTQVKPVKGNGASCCKWENRLQVFEWPDGQQHAVPFHCVVAQTSEILEQLGIHE